MEMTIDEAKRLLNNHIDGVTNYCERNMTDSAILVAIDTMRKYQKIQEIYEKFQKGYDYHMAWLDVVEVLEDGKIY